jgi:hypothetical protein
MNLKPRIGHQPAEAVRRRKALTDVTCLAFMRCSRFNSCQGSPSFAAMPPHFFLFPLWESGQGQSLSGACPMSRTALSCVIVNCILLCSCSDKAGKISDVGQSSKANTTYDETTKNQELASSSWTQFVDRAKSRIPSVIEPERTLKEGEYARHRIAEVRIVSDYIRKSPSVRYAYEGTIRVTSYHVPHKREYKDLSPQLRRLAEMRPSGFTADNTIHFGYQDSKWRFLGINKDSTRDSFKYTHYVYPFYKALFE